jgi:hypothetical protein
VRFSPLNAAVATDDCVCKLLVARLALSLAPPYYP